MEMVLTVVLYYLSFHPPKKNDGNMSNVIE